MKDENPRSGGGSFVRVDLGAATLNAFHLES